MTRPNVEYMRAYKRRRRTEAVRARVCKEPECTTVLSRFNTGKRCALCDRRLGNWHSR